MQKVIDLLIKNSLLDENKLKLFIDKYGEEKLNLVNLMKVRLIQSDAMDEMLINSLRLQEIVLNDLEGIKGINTTDLLKKQAAAAGVKYMDISDVDIDYKLIKRLPLKQLMRYNALPLFAEEELVTVAFENPADFEAKGAIERFFHGKIMEVVLGRKTIIQEVLTHLEENEKVEEYSLDIKTDLAQGGVEDTSDKSPAVLKLIELILSSAIDKGTSDLHIEATENHCIVRFRIDGMLQENFRMEHSIFSPLSSRMKLLANLDIAEKRKPQDGRFTKVVNGRVFDFRISTLPTIYGESIVMRVLDKTRALVQLEDRGMNAIC